MGVEWAESGDLHVSEILRRATGHDADLVHGAAPGSEDPWARAHRVRVARVDPGSIVYERDGRHFELDFDLMQAVRAIVLDE